MFRNKNDVDEILSALGERLKLENSPLTEIVICGGSALHALELLNRTTRDVDVLCMVLHRPNGEIQIQDTISLPEYLMKAAILVAQDFGLEENWLNMGPRGLVVPGLPPGFISRLQSRQYSKSLIVHFISRFDQIHLKLYAAIIEGGGRHYNDIAVLHPSIEEIEVALHWVTPRVQEITVDWRSKIKEILKGLGYDNIAKKF